MPRSQARPKRRERRCQPATASLCAAAAVAGAAFTVPAAATDWPDLEPGEWRFTRTLFAGSEPSTLERQTCVDPVAEWKRQETMSERMGCDVSTRRVAADRLVTTVDCDLPDVGRGSSRSTAIIEAADAYRVEVKSTGVLAKTGDREVLVAKRLGDCPE